MGIIVSSPHVKIVSLRKDYKDLFDIDTKDIKELLLMDKETGEIYCTLDEYLERVNREILKECPNYLEIEKKFSRSAHFLFWDYKDVEYSRGSFEKVGLEDMKVVRAYESLDCEDIIIYYVKVKKKDRELFLKAMEDLRKRMNILKPEYGQFSYSIQTNATFGGR